MFDKKTKRTLNKFFSVLLSLSLLLSPLQIAFAAPFADDSIRPVPFSAADDDDNWKFMRLKDLNSQTVIAVSQFFTEEGFLYQVYNPTLIDTELSFRLHQGQRWVD